MSFQLPDIIIESVIRDGLEDLRRNPERIDDIFSSLTLPYASEKYGVKELDKIKELIQKKDIGVVHSFNEVATREPCYSIQLGNDVEDKSLAHLDDFEEDIDELLTDPQDLADLIVVSSVVTSAYDTKSGKVSVDDAVNLAAVHVNLLWVDVAGTEHKILGGIVNTIGSKTFFIATGATVVTGATGTIKSSLNFKRFEQRGVIHDAQLLIGCHTKNALTTKYIYVLLKFFLTSRKADLISRGYFVSSLQGSDFTRNLKYEGDIVFSRFLTISGKVQDTWQSDQVTLVDNIDTQVLVDKDVADTGDIGLDEQTIQVADD